MILRSLWLRPTVARPVRALMTALGVAIGVASVVSTLLASRAAVASMGSDVETIAGSARLEVTRPGGVDESALGALRPICDEALLVPVVEGTALAPELGDLVRILGVDLLLDAEVRELDLDVGDGDLDAARESMLLGRGAALTRALASTLGVAVGDELDLVVGARPVQLEVAALLEPERFDSAWSRLLLVDVAHAQELFGRLGRVDRVELVPRGDAPFDEAGLAARTAALLPSGYRVEPASARRAEGDRLVRALEFNLTALAGVSILVGIVLVATTLATSVVQRRKQVALLRSLGASRGQIARAVLVEAGAIGLLGGALGVVLGRLGASASLASVRTTVATVAEGVIPGAVRLEPRWALLGLGLGVGASIVAAILPLTEVLRTPPLQGLRGEHPESVARRRWGPRALAFAALAIAAVVFVNLPPLEDRPIWALLAALCILSTLLVLAGPLVDLFAGIHPRFLGTRAATALRLSQASLEAGRKRAAWAAGAVGVAVGLAVAMTTMVGSFRKSVVDWTGQAMPSDLFLRPLVTGSGALAGRVDPEVVALAEELFGAENVDPFHESKAYFRDRPVLLGGAAFPVVAREGGVPFLDGRSSREVFAEAAREGGAVVNEPFSRRYAVGRGDEIELATPAGPIRRRVTGVYRDYSGHTGRVVVDLDDFLAHYPNDVAQSVSIFLPPGADARTEQARMRAALGATFAIDVLDNREVRAEVMDVFERTFGVTVALQVISSVVAGIAVVAVLSALILERRRDLALVRVLGGSRRQLFGLVLGEALLLGVAGALGGLAVGFVVGWVLVAIVNVQSFGWTLQFVLPPSVFVTVAAVVPACLLAGVVPAAFSLRTSPRESLRAPA